MTLKSATGRTAALTVAAGCALALSACSAGMISNTAHQVAAVDGVNAQTPDGRVTLRDLIIHPDTDEHHGSVKFTASSQDVSGKVYTLKAIKVEGKEIPMTGDREFGQDCSLVGDSQKAVAAMSYGKAGSAAVDKAEKTDNGGPCTSYVVTEFDGKVNPGTVKKVEFVFDSATVPVEVPVSLPTPVSGETYLEVDGNEEQGKPGEAAGAEHGTAHGTSHSTEVSSKQTAVVETDSNSVITSTVVVPTTAVTTVTNY